jgi:hypothetical protein
LSSSFESTTEACKGQGQDGSSPDKRKSPKRYFIVARAVVRRAEGVSRFGINSAVHPLF